MITNSKNLGIYTALIFSLFFSTSCLAGFFSTYDNGDEVAIVKDGHSIDLAQISKAIVRNERDGKYTLELNSAILGNMPQPKGTLLNLPESSLVKLGDGYELASQIQPVRIAAKKILSKSVSSNEETLPAHLEHGAQALKATPEDTLHRDTLIALFEQLGNLNYQKLEKHLSSHSKIPLTDTQIKQIIRVNQYLLNTYSNASDEDSFHFANALSLLTAALWGHFFEDIDNIIDDHETPERIITNCNSTCREATLEAYSGSPFFLSDLDFADRNVKRSVRMASDHYWGVNFEKIAAMAFLLNLTEVPDDWENVPNVIRATGKKLRETLKAKDMAPYPYKTEVSNVELLSLQKLPHLFDDYATSNGEIVDIFENVLGKQPEPTTDLEPEKTAQTIKRCETFECAINGSKWLVTEGKDLWAAKYICFSRSMLTYCSEPAERGNFVGRVKFGEDSATVRSMVSNSHSNLTGSTITISEDGKNLTIKNSQGDNIFSSYALGDSVYPESTAHSSLGAAVQMPRPFLFNVEGNLVSVKLSLIPYYTDKSHSTLKTHRSNIENVVLNELMKYTDIRSVEAHEELLALVESAIRSSSEDVDQHLHSIRFDEFVYQ